MKASKKLRFRFPGLTYGNVVSTLALFIALGGVSYAAATLPKKSVGSAQLKKNAVTSAKIKKRAVTGSKIKNQTITGDKIKLSTLGTVPSASSAASADHWTGAIDPVLKKAAPSADNVSSAAALASATPVELASHGTVSVYGKCYTSGGTLFFGIYAATVQDRSLLNSAMSTLIGTPYLDTSTAEGARVLLAGSVSSGSATIGAPPFVGTATLIGPDGKGLSLNVDAFAKNGDLVFGNGPYGVGQSCLFQTSGEKLDLG